MTVLCVWCGVVCVLGEGGVGVRCVCMCVGSVRHLLCVARVVLRVWCVVCGVCGEACHAEKTLRAQVQHGRVHSLSLSLSSLSPLSATMAMINRPIGSLCKKRL